MLFDLYQEATTKEEFKQIAYGVGYLVLIFTKLVMDKNNKTVEEAKGLNKLKTSICKIGM